MAKTRTMESNIAYYKGIHRSRLVLIYGPVNPASTLHVQNEIVPNKISYYHDCIIYTFPQHLVLSIINFSKIIQPEIISL
jgi:hypothetical protein